VFNCTPKRCEGTEVNMSGRGFTFIHSHSHSHSFYCIRKKVCNITVQTEEMQIQQEQAKAHRAYRRPVPKFDC